MRFRRSKPLTTGRRRLNPAPVADKPAKKFSYSSRRSETEQNIGRQTQRDERATSRHAKNFLRKVGLIVLMLAVIVSAVNILSLSTNPKVLPLEGDKSSAFLSDTNVYEEYSSKVLSNSIWNRNKITVKSEEVSQQLVEQYPELSSASMTVPLLAHRPIIYVQPAKPVLVISARNGAFVVASNGKALLRANVSSELNKYNLPLLNDLSGLKLRVGQSALQARDVRFIQTVLTELSAKQYNVESMSLPATSSELDVKIAGQPYLIKFNLQSDTARQQAGTFLSTMQYLKKQNAVPAKYVDVRVNGRAYYQ